MVPDGPRPPADGLARWNGWVPGTGLEPARLSTPDPKSGASANSATLAAKREGTKLALKLKREPRRF